MVRVGKHKIARVQPKGETAFPAITAGMMIAAAIGLEARAGRPLPGSRAGDAGPEPRGLADDFQGSPDQNLVMATHSIAREI